MVPISQARKPKLYRQKTKMMETEVVTEKAPPLHSYDDEHSQFVTSDEGTSPMEILQVLISVSITPLLASLMIPWIVSSKFIPMAFGDQGSRDFIRALVEFSVVMLLPVLTITVFAGESSESEEGSYQHVSYCRNAVNVLILCCCSIVIVNELITRPTWSSIATQWHRFQNKIISLGMGKIPKGSKKQVKLPFFTTYRAAVIYLTVISILAVDFKIFPRRFAKTRTFGFSLMDVGTGSFVFANGLVSPEAKRMTSNFRHVILSSVPLFVLGFARLFTIKGLGYHEVVEEYGMHWNFFFTLALVKIFSAVLFKVLNPKHALKIALLIGFCYDSFLVFTGFQNDYILNPEIRRDESLINANREGIFSAVGYTCIYMMSVYCGQLIFQNKRPLVRIRDWMYYALVSGTQILLLWFLTYLAHTYWNPSSRRVANFTYVLWSVSTNYTTLWLHLVFYIVQNFLQHTGLIYGPLLFHQLESYDKESKIRKIQEDLAKDRLREEAQWRLERDQMLNAETEFELSHLERKLSLVEKKVKEQRQNEGGGGEELSQNELEALSKEMEVELRSVRKKCVEETSLLDVVKNTNSESRGRLAYLPDLTLTPITLTAVAFNGLAVFLIGNLLTGAVNSMITSMYTDDIIALLILCVYSSVITMFSVILYFYRVQLKFW